MPLVFGLFSLFIYILIYSPAVGSEDFITGLMVFCAAQAGCAIIIFSNEKKRWFLFFYLFISFLTPLIVALVFPKFNKVWHMVLIGLTVLAVIGLELFVSDYVKYKKE